MADIARDYRRYRDNGIVVAAIVIDSVGQNAAMVRKLALPFPVFSDPDGETAIKPFDVWDTKGQMAKPATIALGPNGKEAYRYVGVDFVDRPVQDEARTALAALGMPSLQGSVVIQDTITPTPGQRAASLDYLDAYMRGIRSSMSALSDRMLNDWDQLELQRTMSLAERYIAAIAETRRVVSKQ